jgi:hypothetical protein
MRKKEEIERIDLNEFRDKGFLQEVNRQFFHPLGLALEVIVDKENGSVLRLGGIWDARNDPEGMFMADMSDPESIRKAEEVKKLYDEKADYRMNNYGFVIQPIGHKFK